MESINLGQQGLGNKRGLRSQSRLQHPAGGEKPSAKASFMDGNMEGGWAAKSKGMLDFKSWEAITQEKKRCSSQVSRSSLALDYIRNYAISELLKLSDFIDR